MEKYPEIDIVMIVYNQEEFINDTIESVLNQTYKNIRKIIIADDGSEDKTPQIIQEYADKYPQIKPILSKKNEGIAYNINKAIKEVKTKYYSTIAGDDLMLPEKIEKQVEYLNNNPDVAVCSHDMNVFNSETGKSMGRFSELLNYKKFNEKVGVEYLFDPAMNQCPSSYMFRTNHTPQHGYDTRLKYLNELIFDTEVLMNGKLGYINEILGKYRKHEGNVSTSEYRDNFGLEEFLIAYSILTAKYPELYSHIKRGKSSLIFSKVIRAIMQNNKDRAKNLSKVLMVEGNYIKGTFAYILSHLMSPDLLNKVYESKYQQKITGIIYRTI